MLTEISYNREAAYTYAKKWAFERNPRYYDYADIGGDCTNFASQCIYAGCGVMNDTPTYGWYYKTANNKSPSWTGVPYLYNFLTQNTGVGPFGTQADIAELQIGDIVQLSNEEGRFYHTMVVTEPGDQEHLLVAAHDSDAFNRPLTSYQFADARFVHIAGARRWEQA